MKELLERYKKLCKKKAYYLDDIVATEEALKDRLIDYLTRTELKEDLIEDERQIRIIDQELIKLKQQLDSLGISLEEENKENTK